MELLECAAYLRAHDNYLLVTHQRPDGDTLGSASALCHALRRLGKTAHLYKNPEITEMFVPFVSPYYAPEGFVPETCVSVDVAENKLLALGFEGKISLKLDHHVPRGEQPENAVIWTHSAACGELVLALIDALVGGPDKTEADLLYIAVSTDTGCFKFSNTSANTHRTAAALIDAGADVYPINKVFFDTKSFARLRLEAKLTDTMEFYAGGEVGVCTMPKKLLAAFTVTEDDLDSISGFARSIEGVKIGVMIREVEDGLGKISLRTEAPYDASAICQRLGGGGHAAAAGASVPGGIAGAKAAILRALAESGVRL